MNRTKEIKRIIGNAVKEAGFKYLRLDNGIVWIFSREINDVEEHVLIQQHTKYQKEYKLLFSTTARGNGRLEIGDILTEYADTKYWPAETDEEFIKLMEWFTDFIKEHGLSVLNEMLIEKSDSFETPERKLWFKENREELIRKYESKYHILSNGSSYEKLHHIDDVLYENRKVDENDENSVECAYDLILGMAAILSNIILEEKGSEIFYDTYRVEIHIPHKSGYLTREPIKIISGAWIRYHNDKYSNGSRDHVWGTVSCFIHDSTTKMEKEEFFNYVVKNINDGQNGKHDIWVPDENDKTGADFMIQEKKHRVLIKCIHSHRKVGSKIMSDELKTLSLKSDDRLIVATNQECADSARKVALKYPNKTWVLTCDNIFALGYEIHRLGNYD